MKKLSIKTSQTESVLTQHNIKGEFTMKKVISVLAAIVIICSTAISSLAYDTSDTKYEVKFEVNTTDSRVRQIESIYLERGTSEFYFPEGPARDGYIFKEWNTASDGNGVSFESGDKLTVINDTGKIENMTYYAIWEKTESSPVAIMYLCATANSLTGHVWLYFDNIGDETINVGYVELDPGEQTSVGSLRNTRTDGGGTYYNGEAYMSKNIETTGKHTTYLSMALTGEQLEIVNNQIMKRNSYNLIVWNCGNFATAVWNSVSPHKIIHITFPVFTIFQMLLHGAKKGLTMTRPEIEDCYKQVGEGVICANSSSFNSSCV